MYKKEEIGRGTIRKVGKRVVGVLFTGVLLTTGLAGDLVNIGDYSKVNVVYADENERLLDESMYEVVEFNSNNLIRSGVNDYLETDLRLKLDDAVKEGDKIHYGIKSYDYQAGDGKTYSNYLEVERNSFDKKVNDLVYEGIVIGTLTVNERTLQKEGVESLLTNPKMSELGLTYTTRPLVYTPVVIEFNSNIEKLKGVEIDIKTIFQITGTLARGKDYNVDNVESIGGKSYISTRGEFRINNQAIELEEGVKYRIVNTADTYNLDKNNEVKFTPSQYNNTRGYYLDDEGNYYMRPKDRITSSVSFKNKGKTSEGDIYLTKEVTYEVVVPKELQRYMTITLQKTNPNKLGGTVVSRYNPLVDYEGVYVGNTTKALDRAVDWDVTRDSYYNEDGDLVYTQNFKTKDGEGVSLHESSGSMLNYSLDSSLEQSEYESYSDASNRESGKRWGVPEWDKLLKENPIQLRVVSVNDKGEQEEHYMEKDAEFYTTSLAKTSNIPKGTIRVKGVDEDVEEITRENIIPYETVRRDNPYLLEGETKVVQEGEEGSKTVTTKTPTLNDKPVGEPIITEETTKTPINEVVLVGTGKVGELVEEQELPIPYETIIKYNPELPEGTSKVVQEGEEGLEKVTTKTPTFNDEPSGKSEVEREVVKEPIDEVIEVGTGVKGENVRVEEEPIPYESKVVENPELEEGNTRIIQEGVEGRKTTATKTSTLNGELVGEPIITEEVIEPIEEIIEVGTKEKKPEPIKSETVVVEVTTIPFETEIIENPELEEGISRVIQEGEVGRKETTTVTKFSDGEVEGEPLVTEDVTKEPIKEVIEVGTGAKKDVTDEEDEELEETPVGEETEKEPSEEPSEEPTEEPSDTEEESGEEDTTEEGGKELPSKEEGKKPEVEGTKVEVEDEKTSALNPETQEEETELADTGMESSKAMLPITVGAGLLGLGLVMIFRRKRV